MKRDGAVFSNKRVKGFLKRDGRRMVNGHGEEVILRGFGAGNWTNPEGFMIGSAKGLAPIQDELLLPVRMERGRGMEQTIKELCGTAYMERFWPVWYKNQLDREDIKKMAELGYNSIRLPITARVFLKEEPGYCFIEESFSMLNQVLDWCEEFSIYAIIDMHGAPGGQSALGCDDGIDNMPHMFLEPESRERAMVLWEEIARRCHDREIVGGYDLLNEPISPPVWHKLLPELASFYDEVITRIRNIDKNHMMMLEGMLFATDMNLFTRSFDREVGNWCISIHLYHFSPEIRTLYKYLEPSLRLEVPLWIGEGYAGNEEMTVFYEICANYHIGFNLWAWKAADDTEGETGAARYLLPKRWDEIVAYINEGGPRPSYAECAVIFDELLENIRLENCRFDEIKHRYILRKPGIVLPAAGYDDEGEAEEHKKGSWHYGNSFDFRTQDGKKLCVKSGITIPNSIPLPGSAPGAKPLQSLLLELSQGEFACYTIRGAKQGCHVYCKARALEPCKIQCSASKSEKEKTLILQPSEDMEPIFLMKLYDVEEDQIVITLLEGTVQLEEIRFLLPNEDGTNNED